MVDWVARKEGKAETVKMTDAINMMNGSGQVLEVAGKELRKRKVGYALEEVEFIALFLDPRHKAHCSDACSNGDSGGLLVIKACEALELVGESMGSDAGSM